MLSASTIAVRSQLKPVSPPRKGIRWRWVGLGTFLILGLITVLQGTLFLVAWLIMDLKTSVGIRDLSALTNELLGLSIAAAILFLLAFGLGGAGLAWLSKRNTALEPVIAAFVVLFLLGMVGSALTKDAPIVIGVLAVPLATLAGLGGRLGELFSMEERK